MQATRQPVGIEVVRSSGELGFKISAGAHSGTRLVLFQVADASTSRILWLVAPLGATIDYPVGLVLEPAGEISSAAAPVLADAAEQFGAPVGYIAYGVIPAGFEQFIPAAGDPEPLVVSRSYVAAGIGRSSCRVEFEA